ncbi:MAG: glycosyltransferase [Planctomycetaceae bacterium]|nr:glycosyltransferase [Planctomycetaceae bacterium]
MKVLHLIPYMHPSAGGPPVVVDQWCFELRKQGIEAEVLTTDSYDDGSSPDWKQDYSARYPITVCNFKGPRGFGYSPELKREFVRRLPEFDLVHVHNVWSYCNQLAAKFCPRFNVPFVVSTHGMLDPNSMGRKPWKKRLYGRLVEWPSLRKARGLFFTHTEEERLAHQTCVDLPEGFIASLGVEAPPARSREELAAAFLERFPECTSGPRIMLLSRLHSKKGLDLLIPAARQVMNGTMDGRLILVGPGEPEYLEELKALCLTNGIAERTVFTGPLAGDMKWGALAAADVFALPSYQENFAIALVEALRMGTPAVISNRINIWQDLVNAGAAIHCELNQHSVAKEIGGLLSSTANRQAMGDAGRELAESRYTWPNSAASVAAHYSIAVNKRPPSMPIQ